MRERRGTAPTVATLRMPPPQGSGSSGRSQGRIGSSGLAASRAPGFSIYSSASPCYARTATPQGRERVGVRTHYGHPCSKGPLRADARVFRHGRDLRRIRQSDPCLEQRGRGTVRLYPPSRRSGSRFPSSYPNRAARRTMPGWRAPRGNRALLAWRGTRSRYSGAPRRWARAAGRPFAIPVVRERAANVRRPAPRRDRPGAGRSNIWSTSPTATP